VEGRQERTRRTPPLKEGKIGWSRGNEHERLWPRRNAKKKNQKAQTVRENVMEKKARVCDFDERPGNAGRSKLPLRDP